MGVVTTGMGPSAAARAADAVLGGSIVAVVVAGVAGGCDPALGPGAVVVATSLCDLDGRPLELPTPPPEVVATVVSAHPQATAAPVASGDTVVDDLRRRARLAAAGAAAVETEAAGWAPACAAAGIPLVVVRAILDTPVRPIGPAAALIAPGADAPSPGRLLGLALRPSAWRALPRLARDVALAERRAAAAAATAVAALQRLPR